MNIIYNTPIIGLCFWPVRPPQCCCFDKRTKYYDFVWKNKVSPRWILLVCVRVCSCMCVCQAPLARWVVKKFSNAPRDRSVEKLAWNNVKRPQASDWKRTSVILYYYFLFIDSHLRFRCLRPKTDWMYIIIIRTGAVHKNSSDSHPDCTPFVRNCLKPRCLWIAKALGPGSGRRSTKTSDRRRRARVHSSLYAGIGTR